MNLLFVGPQISYFCITFENFNYIFLLQYLELTVIRTANQKIYSISSQSRLKKVLTQSFDEIFIQIRSIITEKKTFLLNILDGFAWNKYNFSKSSIHAVRLHILREFCFVSHIVRMKTKKFLLLTPRSVFDLHLMEQQTDRAVVFDA